MKRVPRWDWNGVILSVNIQKTAECFYERIEIGAVLKQNIRASQEYIEDIFQG